jgi:glycosyltransferase involved in cell wall biosynthesis
MKVLILTRYSRLGASSRVRLYQFIPLLEGQGMICKVRPLLNDQYVRDLYGGKRPGLINLARCYLSGLRTVLGARRFDVVLIEKEVFPFVPALAEIWLNIIRVPYIADYDDAIFHNYDLHPKWLVRKLLGGKIAVVMRRSAAVVCGNDYLADYARKANSALVRVIPTVIDMERFSPAERNGSGDIVIGWIGSPFTLKYLRPLLPVFNALAERYPLRLHIVGGGTGIGFKNECVIPWTEAEEVEQIRQFDIGIMPLEDSPWEKGKCGYKLIQYMACGLPVVGSPVGINKEIILEGRNGFQADGTDRWTVALGHLLGNPRLRGEMGMAGRKIAEERYSLQKAAIRWIDLIHATVHA